MTTTRRLLIVLALCAGALAATPAAQAQTPAPATCPLTFNVLQSDRIGTYVIAPGAYQITVLNPGALGCTAASNWLQQFLESFSGTLPNGWSLDPASGNFYTTSGAGFSLTLVGPAQGGGGQYPASGVTCPTTFAVQHNDTIGAFGLSKGPYTMTLLAQGGMTCGQAATNFARFLQDYDGILPSPWIMDAATGTFSRGASTRVGFRVQPAPAPANPTPAPSGYTTPGSQCAGTFQVRHNDRIGALKLAAGNYRITRLGSTCAASSKLLAQFLQRPDGKLPSPWKLNAGTATFNGANGAGFRIKPA
jgi:hypothetical protein